MVFLSNDPNFTGLPDVQAKGVRYGKAIACILAGTQSVTKYKECGFMLTQEKERELQNFARGGPGLVGLLQGPRGTGHLCGTGTERLFPDGVDGNVEPARDKFTQPL